MKDLTLGFSKIRNQNPLGSCSCQAACAILEYMRTRAAGDYANPNKPHFSPRYLYYYVRNDCAIPQHIDPPGRFIHDLEEGTEDTALKNAIQTKGVCLETSLKYITRDITNQVIVPGQYNLGDKPLHLQGVFAQTPPASLNPEAQANINQYLAGFRYVDPNSWSIEIEKENPIWIAIYTTQEFRKPINNNLLINPGKIQTTSDEDGGHAIVIVAYDCKYMPDPTKPHERYEAFKIRNSWGDGWGDQGYLWITRQALEQLHDYFHTAGRNSLAFINKIPYTPFPAPQPPRPSASFIFNPKQGAAPLNVTFINTSAGAITAYHWDFGDGATSTGRNANYIYSTPGRFSAILTVTNTSGSTSHSAVINVLPPTPTPAPSPTPPPRPAPTPSPGGKFIYQWWLFNDEKSIKLAEANNLPPIELTNRRIAYPLSNQKSIDGHTGFDEDISRLKSLAHIGKHLCLGACKSADPGHWRWTSKQHYDLSTNEQEVVMRLRTDKNLIAAIINFVFRKKYSIDQILYDKRLHPRLLSQARSLGFTAGQASALRTLLSKLTR
jgi:PKD repeat protein